ncbi:hypothetical protein ACFL2Y_03115 [Candidatus Omnitrophota bacterium]
MPMSVFAFLTGVYVHLFLGFFYLHFIQIMDRTPTARIMIELENSPNKRMTQDELKKIYSMESKICDALNDMVILGRLNKDPNYYSITDIGKRHMKFFQIIRNYLRLKRN